MRVIEFNPTLVPITPTSFRLRHTKHIPFLKLLYPKLLNQFKTFLNLNCGINHFKHKTIWSKFHGTHKRKYKFLLYFYKFMYVLESCFLYVLRIEKDFYRTGFVALVIFLNTYLKGNVKYITATDGLKPADKITMGNQFYNYEHNYLLLKYLPMHITICNISGQHGTKLMYAKSAGTKATIILNRSTFKLIKLPSTQIKLIYNSEFAVLGRISNLFHRLEKIGKAGFNLWAGKKPYVRGLAKNPVDHPHGGGEGKSSVGLITPKTKSGKKVMLKKL